ncbi:MAG TPA: GDP-mannose 4,6-dehydratase [Verrucomicrobiales bacterium]|nr:GDP-mannose 4,6-dehydratase [Verrucomicrobiales bacterium]
MKPRALITGVTGQDGWYLRELLEGKGYEVYGWRRDECDVTDPEQVRVAVQQAQPNEIYHLAAQSHVGESEGAVQETRRVNVQGTENLLRSSQREVPEARFFFASSCHVFGGTTETPQKETTPFHPVNPYGASKLEATLRVRAARQAGLFAVNGFLYNHESPRRGENFVTQKICRGAAAIAAGQSRELRLGDTSMRRDWSDARDIVRGMWLSLQVEQPDDYILASGEAHTVQAVVEIAFETVGLDWEKHVVRDQQFNRSADPACLVGDPSKARAVLDWEPKKGFRELIVEMTRAAQRALT